MSSKEAIKAKATSKKTNLPSNMEEFEIFLKSQHNIMSKLKSELKSASSKVKLSGCGTSEKDNYILQLQQSINQREADIHKLTANLEQLKAENSEILMQFSFFKEKFCQLETDYDQNLQNLKQDNENLQTQKTIDNQKIEELLLKCQNFEQSLQFSANDYKQLNNIHTETLRNLEQMTSNFEQQQNEFELYKNRVKEDRRLYDENIKLDIDNLRDELKQKDEILKQCILDKNTLEKEKNLVIAELNNKIYRIENAFNQPTKFVQPMVNVAPQINNSDNNSNSESSIDNVAISKPQVRKPLENLSVQHISNNENKNPDQHQTQRSYKFKRPVQPQTSSQLTNVGTDNAASRKRRNQPVRQQHTIKTYNEFSLSSSDDDDDDDSNYNNFSQQLWRPNNEVYVPDTDASEGFAKTKRAKK